MHRGILLIALVVPILAGCGTVPTDTPQRYERAATTLPDLTGAKVVLVILENKHADDALKQPFLRALAEKGRYLSNYYGVAHPSQPNYVALVSGSIAGVDGDAPATLNRDHLGKRLSDRGFSWKVYAQGYPTGQCYLKEKYLRPDSSDAIHLKTIYVRRHVPFLSFADINCEDKKRDDVEARRRCEELCKTHITDFEAFKNDADSHSLPDFSLVIPDLYNDAHDKRSPEADALSQADDWLMENFKTRLDDPKFKKNVIFIVTFDENDDNWPYPKVNNKVYLALVGEHVIPDSDRKPVAAVYDHYDLHRTIEAIFGLDSQQIAPNTAVPIEGIWR